MLLLARFGTQHARLVREESRLFFTFSLSLAHLCGSIISSSIAMQRGKEGVCPERRRNLGFRDTRLSRFDWFVFLSLTRSPFSPFCFSQSPIQPRRSPGASQRCGAQEPAGAARRTRQDPELEQRTEQSMVMEQQRQQQRQRRDRRRRRQRPRRTPLLLLLLLLLILLGRGGGIRPLLRLRPRWPHRRCPHRFFLLGRLSTRSRIPRCRRLLRPRRRRRRPRRSPRSTTTQTAAEAKTAILPPAASTPPPLAPCGAGAAPPCCASTQRTPRTRASGLTGSG